MKKKKQLFEEAVQCHPGIEFEVQKLSDQFSTDKFNIKVLFRPVAHPDLNPIEMAWAILKREVASGNFNFIIPEVVTLTEQAASKITRLEFKIYVDHVIKVENNFKKLDNYLDDLFEKYLEAAACHSHTDSEQSEYREKSSHEIPITDSELTYLQNHTEV